MSCVVFSLSLIWGCRGTRLAGNNLNGSAPLIVYVQSGKIMDGEYTATSSFRIGDLVNFKLTVIDDDLDIQMLYIRRFYPKDAVEPASRYKPMELHTLKDRRESFLLNEPLEIPGPSGEHRLEFQIEDEQGNKSNTYKVFMIVH